MLMKPERGPLSRRLMDTAVRFQRSIRMSYDRRYYFPQVARRIARLYSLEKGLLDIGSGKGYFGDALQTAARQSTTVVSTDMFLTHEGKTPYVQASATELPFADGTFDVSTMFFVLHHLDQPEVALREAKRVSDRIVVQEDTYRNRWQKKLFAAHVRRHQADAAYNGSSVKTDKEWKEVFVQAGLEVTSRRRIRKFGYPVPRYEYHLAPLPSETEDK